ncbi:MAG TPA: hypothetical protein VJO14_00290, partial [Bacteroidota bacterium]|nr:hypothetical protein [Bacteroidota bacterium]
MKNLLISTIAPLASLLLILGAGGCYTQLGTVRNEGAYEGDTTSEITGNSAAEDDSDASYGYDDQDQQYGYGEDWGMQSRFGFNYYYPNTYWPSVTFSAAYADPWGYWYGYDPWYYRPYAGYYSP